MRRFRRSRWVALPVAAALAVVLAGCSQQQLQGFLPGSGETTNHTSTVVGLWTTSWLVLLAVGLTTWGLIIWAVVVYRRRRGQTGLPVQLRYNMPIEIFYTVVPFFLVLGLFAFTARDQAQIEQVVDSDHTVQVYGKRWGWDFNYVNEDVYTQGTQVRETSEGLVDESTLPTLVLPVDQSVEIELKSRDVIHSFWIVDFLYKKDTIPGKTNFEYFTPTEIGTFSGKCAELCGEFHSLMLFNVEVVSQEDYDAYIESLRDQGFEGQIGDDYNTNSNLPGREPLEADETGTGEN